jgi:glycine hydroxymethyltransferase
LAIEHRPKMLIAGGSAYSRIIDFARLGDIARRVKALLLVDMAHFAGLVATGFYPDPFPHADVVTTTTYKSLRGARGGMVLWNNDALSKKINNAVFPGVQGSVMLHAVAGKAVCLHEAASAEFVDYNRQVIDNARALADTLVAEDIRVVSNGTDTGLMLVDLRSKSITGAIAVDCLERAGLTCNKNLIPFDPEPPEVASGLRLSVNTGTARGFETAEFHRVGLWIAEVLNAVGNDDVEKKVFSEVKSLCSEFPIYET